MQTTQTRTNSEKFGSRIGPTGNRTQDLLVEHQQCSPSTKVVNISKEPPCLGGYLFTITLEKVIFSDQLFIVYLYIYV